MGLEGQAGQWEPPKDFKQGRGWFSFILCPEKVSLTAVEQEGGGGRTGNLEAERRA